MLQNRLVFSGISPTLGNSWSFNLTQVRSKIVLPRLTVRNRNLSSLSSKAPSMAAKMFACEKLVYEMKNYGIKYLASELATSGTGNVRRAEGGEICGGEMVHT